MPDSASELAISQTPPSLEAPTAKPQSSFPSPPYTPGLLEQVGPSHFHQQKSRNVAVQLRISWSFGFFKAFLEGFNQRPILNIQRKTHHPIAVSRVPLQKEFPAQEAEHFLDGGARHVDVHLKGKLCLVLQQDGNSSRPFSHRSDIEGVFRR